MDSFEFLFNEQNRILEHYDGGEYLYRNGTPAIGVFFICSGRVQVINQTDEGFLVQETKTAGDIVALDEIELLYYVSDAIALESTEVYFLDKSRIKEILRRNI